VKATASLSTFFPDWADRTINIAKAAQALPGDTKDGVAAEYGRLPETQR